MMKNLKRNVTVAIMATILLGSTLSVCAAPKTMADGTVFDADFYAETYPDVKQALGTDEAALYNHYVTYGKAEGRMPHGTDVDVTYSKTVVGRTPDKGDVILTADQRSIGGVKIEAKQPLTPSVILADMQKTLPTGTAFNDSTYYFWNGYKKGNNMRGGSGCAAFAMLLSDCIYDNAPATMQTTGELTINVYDIVLLAGGAHMAFVTGIDNENGTITVAEANYNGAVRWGGTYKISDICGVITRQ